MSYFIVRCLKLLNLFIYQWKLGDLVLEFRVLFGKEADQVLNLLEHSGFFTHCKFGDQCALVFCDPDALSDLFGVSRLFFQFPIDNKNFTEFITKLLIEIVCHLGVL